MIQPTNATQAYPQGGANAVSINIFNPQAYGSAPNSQNYAQNLAQPYDYTNSLYNMPQASLYQPQGVQYQPQYQQFMPMQNPMMPMAPIQYPQLQAPQQFIPIQSPIQPMVQPQIQPIAQPQAQMPQLIPAPAPQLMPESVIQEQQPAQAVQEQPAKVETPSVEVVSELPQGTKVVDVNSLIADLKGNDIVKKEAAINKIAEYAQDVPEVAKQVVSEPLMQALVDVIKEDTTGLEGPTEQQIAIAQKVAKGEQLTPEEDKLSENLSPRDAANQNRMFSLYTLAMLQKIQRDEVDDFIANQKQNGQQPIEALKINDLYGYNDVVNVIKNDTRPEVKIAGIQALRYIARPEDSATVKEVLADSLNSTDEQIKLAAQEAVEVVGKKQ